MKAIITGVYGQDGSYLGEILTDKGYEVYGIVNRDMSENSLKIRHELEHKGIRFKVICVDLLDYERLKDVLIEINPDEIYHLAAQHVSAEEACLTVEKDIFENNIHATANILDICYNYLKNARVLTAGSCLMYDGTNTDMQDIHTPFQSVSYYGIAKITENMLVKMYRSRGMFACTAILYNHESHRRAAKFVTQKIVQNMIKIKRKEIETFSLGNLDVVKDWGYACDYAYGMYLMLRKKEPEDFILATNELHTINDFISECARQLDITDWRKHVKLDDGIIVRKIDTILRGSCLEAEEKLGWKKTKTFQELITEMIENSLWT